MHENSCDFFILILVTKLIRKYRRKNKKISGAELVYYPSFFVPDAALSMKNQVSGHEPIFLKNKKT